MRVADGLLMFRSSVAAFYAWLVYLFYNSAAPIRRDRCLLFLLPHLRKRIDGEKNWAAMVDLLTLTGTLLAAFTLLGIGFFVYAAPHLR